MPSGTMQGPEAVRRCPALLLLVCASLLSAAGISEALPHISFYHRFSSALRGKAREHGVEWAFPAWTDTSAEYHNFLATRDLARHGRRLASTAAAAAPAALSFSQGNATQQFSQLFYAIVDVGTPNVSHFVALDTGSDLFWMPCECIACAPASAPAFEGLPSLNVYTPTRSTTSKPVSCGSPDCDVGFSACSNQSRASSQCLYEANYLSDNTSSSGTVYQDVIYLAHNDGNTTAVTPEVVVGCGQTQSGLLLDASGGVPDGLLGLGRANFSVPSLIAATGLVGDSFSVCMSLAEDGSGRIVFGDYGGANLSTTPLLTSNGTQQSYAAYLTGIGVAGDEDSAINIENGAPIIFDTGTSFTLLPTSLYSATIAVYDNQTSGLDKIQFDGTFELCYAAPSESSVVVPTLVYLFDGNSTLPAVNPFAVYYFQANNTLAGFCLGILDSGADGPLILGASDMIGYNVVFNREQGTLGWEFSYCNDTAVDDTQSPAVSPILGPGVSPIVAPASGPALAFPPPPPGVTPAGPITSPVAPAPPGAASPAPPPSAAHRTSRPSATVLLALLSSTLLAAAALRP